MVKKTKKEIEGIKESEEIEKEHFKKITLMLNKKLLKRCKYFKLILIVGSLFLLCISILIFLLGLIQYPSKITIVNFVLAGFNLSVCWSNCLIYFKNNILIKEIKLEIKNMTKEV